MRRAGLIAVLLFAAFPAFAAKAPKPLLAWPAGIYSNISMSKYTGDLGGMEARFYEEGGKHMVEFVMCEGWCNDAYKVPLARGDKGFMFDTVEEIHFVAWREGKNLRVQGWFGRQEFESKPERLVPATKLYGIAVARNEMKSRKNEKK